MAYPTGLDDLQTAIPADAGGHYDHHRALAVAVEAVEAKVGVSDSPAADANDGDVLTADGLGGTLWTAPASFPEPTEDGTVLYGASDGSTSWQVLQTILNNAVEAAVISAFGNALYSQTVTLSSADILDLHNTPITLVAAPGAGKFLVPHRWVVVYTYGSSDYLIDSDPDIYFAGAGSNTLTTMLGQSNGGNESRTGNWGSCPEDAPLLAGGMAGNPTDGDGTLTVTVWYSIEDVP